MSNLLANWSRRLAAIPTAFHLWCAECELRMAEPQNATLALRHARARMLDLLRTYRQRGEFPDNTHDETRLAPCFVDSEGRQCAVAFLMDQSGQKDAVKQIVDQANLARIAEMRFAELDRWAGESGLTKAELARIQPGYPPTPEQAEHYARIFLTLCFVGALAVNSIFFNSCRLIGGYKPRITTILSGIALGFILIYLACRIETRAFAHTSRLYYEVSNLQMLAFPIGMLSIVCAIIPICARRGKSPPSEKHSDITRLDDYPSHPLSQHVKVIEHGLFKPGDRPKDSMD